MQKNIDRPSDKEVEISLPITVKALFFAFVNISICGFAGPIVWARRMFTEERHWLSDTEFADILSFCQFLPGPNVVSTMVCIGAKQRGLAGALAALAGFILLPWIFGFALGVFLLSYAQTVLLQGILRGITATAAGLIITAGIRLLSSHRRRPVALAIAALAFVGLAIAKLPLLIVVLTLMPLSVALARPQRMVV